METEPGKLAERLAGFGIAAPGSIFRLFLRRFSDRDGLIRALAFTVAVNADGPALKVQGGRITAFGAGFDSPYSTASRRKILPVFSAIND
jgi:hypothetical protein